jgi:hypothetical protein
MVMVSRLRAGRILLREFDFRHSCLVNTHLVVDAYFK